MALLAGKKRFGMTATDKVTGFVGIVTGYAQYITGCDQYLVAPKCDKPDTIPDSHWLDANRLNFTKTVKAPVIRTGKSKGADKAAPRK